MTRQNYIRALRDIRRMIMQTSIDTVTTCRVMNCVSGIDRSTADEAVEALNKAQAELSNPNNRFGETSKAKLEKKLERLLKKLGDEINN